MDPLSRKFSVFPNTHALSKQIFNLVQVIGEEKTIELTDRSEGRIRFVSC